LISDTLQQLLLSIFRVCKSFEAVILVQVEVTDDLLMEIASLPSLYFLNLSGCWNFSDKALNQCLSKLNNTLIHLSLANCAHITEKSLQGIKQLNCLKYLDLTACYKLSPSAYAKLGELSKLEKMNIGASKLLNPKSVSHLTQFKNIKVLDISECVSLSDRFVI
jgi:hypothetical protein